MCKYKFASPDGPHGKDGHWEERAAMLDRTCAQASGRWLPKQGHYSASSATTAVLMSFLELEENADSGMQVPGWALGQ